MVINAVCPHCKRVYPVDEQYAGQTFSCETCGNPFTVPTPGVVQPVAAVPAAEVGRGTVEYRSGMDEISRERMLAGRICFVLAGLMYLSLVCIGCGGIGLAALPKGHGPGGAMAFIAVLLVVVGVIAGGVGTTYLLCGLNIRKGGHVSAIVALVLASLHELLVVIGIVAGVLQAVVVGRGAAVPPAQFALQMVIQVILCLALAQLIYYLIKVVREPRV